VQQNRAEGPDRKKMVPKQKRSIRFDIYLIVIHCYSYHLKLRCLIGIIYYMFYFLFLSTGERQKEEGKKIPISKKRIFEK